MAKRKRKAKPIPSGNYEGVITRAWVDRLGRLRMKIKVSSGPYKGRIVKA